MLTQYKNIDTILNSKNSVSAERFNKNIQSKFEYVDVNKPLSDNIDVNAADTTLEFHVYSNDTWISGNHNVKLTPYTTNNFKDPSTGQILNFKTTPATIDIYKEFSDLKITSGNFRFVVNFNRNLIGNYQSQYLAIDQISDDRTELKLYALNIKDVTFKQQLNQFIRTVANGKQTAAQNRRVGPRYIDGFRNTLFNTVNTFKTYLLNFSRNKNFVFVNSVVVGEFVYIKLLEPLPDDIDINFKCWLAEELKPSHIDTVSITPYVAPKTYNKLSSANFAANANYNTSTSTGLKNWNDLLGSSVQTSQQIIDTYFSGSGVKLNIDYRDFNNFVFYSSAEERVKNFKYKLELLEYYTSQVNSLSTISGSISANNVADYNLRKTNLISSLDAFEKFLYYETTSSIKTTTYDIPLESANVANLTGSYITPTPKNPFNDDYTYYGTASYGFSNYSIIDGTPIVSTTSSVFTNWYSGLLDSASLYDTLNLNALTYSIPEYIRVNSSNSDLDLFVNMLGHHYDIMYTYINHMSRIHKREENPKLGMPNELLYSVAKQFGWNLTNGNQSDEIWKYVFGTDSAGNTVSGSNSVIGTSTAGQDMTYTIWRRIVNNLPLLLKSKGTSRSIKALLSCYGVPQSLITVKEYGGPRIDRAPVYEKVNFDYALDLINNTSGTVSVNYTQPINSVELRFRTDNVVKNPVMPSTMNLYTIGSNTVTIDYTSGTLGTIRINGTASANIEMFDGGWLNTILRTSGNTLQVVAKRSKYGKIVATVSASATASFASSGLLTIGGTTGGSRLLGQVQELRLWSSSLSDSAFSNHTKAPAAYDGNVNSYDELYFRLPLTQKINHNTNSTKLGVQPVASTISASFNGWSSAEPYDSIEETYYYDGISLGAGTFDDNKVRIESNQLIGNLDVKTRSELSEYDTAPLDSNKLGIYFSPQTMINEDIIAQLGFITLDEYIGDPGNDDKYEYPDLIQQAHEYWKKYTDKNDINSYIKIFTLFDLSFFKQLEQLLPARVKPVTGILLQPNILERSKYNVLPEVLPLDLTHQTNIPEIVPEIDGIFNIYDTILPDVSPTLISEYTEYTALLESNVIDINGYDDDQLTGFLTASADKKYSSTKYSYDYLYQSGSTYVTGSTPYWRREGVLPNYFKPTVSSTRSYKKLVSTYGIYGQAVYGYNTYYTPYTPAELQDYLPTGLSNLWYDGSKLSSPGFNVRSTETVDGGPVVEWNNTSGNQLIYQSTSGQGQLQVKAAGLNNN